MRNKYLRKTVELRDAVIASWIAGATHGEIATHLGVSAKVVAELIYDKGLEARLQVKRLRGEMRREDAEMAREQLRRKREARKHVLRILPA